MKKYIIILALSFLMLILIVTPASATVRKTGSQGDYFPLTFHFADGDVPALIDVASINVLFDPPGLSATPWKHHDIQGLDAPTLEFTSGEPYRLEMDLFFDRYEEGKSVREYTDKIEKLALVHQELHRPPTAFATPACLITWGDKTYACEVETTETEFIEFLGESAARAAATEEDIPVRAVMHIVFSTLKVKGGKGIGSGNSTHKRPGPAGSKEISGTESEIIQAHFDILRDAVKTSIDDSREKERNIKGGSGQGIEQSMLSKVDNAEASFERENIEASIHQLEALINEVEAQRGKAITEKNADMLKELTESTISLITQFPLQLACVQPPSGIIGWWSGDNTLDLINGNNAVLHDDTNFASGKVGNAFNLDGVGDYASIPYSSDLEPSEITVEFWVSGPQMNQQPGNTGSGVTLIENSAANYQGWSIFVTPSMGIGTVIGDGTQWNPVISNFGLYYPAGWRHVAMTYDGTYLQLYLDGVPQLGPLGNQVSNAQLSTGRDINIGASWNNGSFARFFKGLIDEVEIYERALTASEIQSIYNAGSAGKCKPNVCVAAPSNLVGWWTMDDAAGSLVAVDRASGNSGTVNGATLGVTGKVATTADFDGVDDYIEVPDNADLNITDAITIDAWVKLDSVPVSGDRIVSRGIVNTGGSNVAVGYSLGINALTQAFFHYRDVNGGGHAIPSPSILSTGAWHHVAATLDTDADVVNIYIDGQLDIHIDYYNLPPIDPSSNPLFIGSLGTAGYNIDGKIDELEIFNRALSPFEIWAIYNAGTAGKCRSLTPVPWPGEEVE